MSEPVQVIMFDNAPLNLLLDPHITYQFIQKLLLTGKLDLVAPATPLFSLLYSSSYRC